MKFYRFLFQFFTQNRGPNWLLFMCSSIIPSKRRNINKKSTQQFFVRDLEQQKKIENDENFYQDDVTHHRQQKQMSPPSPIRRDTHTPPTRSWERKKAKSTRVFVVSPFLNRETEPAAINFVIIIFPEKEHPPKKKNKWGEGGFGIFFPDQIRDEIEKKKWLLTG